LGLIDADYRIALRAQIRINRSSGTPEDLIAITTLSISAGQAFTYEEAYPAAITIEVLDTFTLNILVLLDNLIRAKDGGVRLYLEYSLEPEEDCFTFSDDDSDPADTLRGWADDSPVTVGGYMTDVLSSTG